MPPEQTGEFSGENRYVTVKYRISDGEPRRRFRTLILEMINRLAQAHGTTDGSQASKTIGWSEYQESNDEKIAALEEAILEVAHLVATLARTDGAVVMTKRYEILGFGGEISGQLPGVETVWKALNVEGTLVEEEPTEIVGTRHRSAYRMCNELPDVLAVVVSQDGGVRFVRRQGDSVTYWDHA